MLNFSQQETFLVAYRSCRRCTGRQLEWAARRIQASASFPTLSAAGCHTVPSLPLYPPISAQPLMAVLLLPLSLPIPTQKKPKTPNLVVDGAPWSGRGRAPSPPGPLEMRPLLGLALLLARLLDCDLSTPYAPSVSQRHKVGVFLALHSLVLSLDMAHGAPKAV